MKRTQIAQPQSKEARERMKKRARLLTSAKKRLAVVPPAPEQKKRQAAEKLVARALNREQLALHTRWRPGLMGAQKVCGRWRPKRLWLRW
ncbi:hypothetical protein [Enterobacter sp. Ap-1006]|uniref:hypothetical protein n=1 Tax=Enterobacter sp. Ap-1006 TaxID=2608345 RepID=UPI00336AE7E4